MENAAFWERMYAANIGRMIGVCHRYVNDLALAEDLAHEAFLKAMERSDTYRATGNFEAWLMRITVNHAIQHLRESMDTVPFVEEEIPNVVPEVPSIWETDFTQEELLEAVQQLPVPQRTVFNLYAIDGQSHTCIADLLNISIASSNLVGVDEVDVFGGGAAILGPALDTYEDTFVETYAGDWNCTREGIFLGTIDLALATRDIFENNPISGEPDYRPEVYKNF